ncbi:hypothetical protein R1flu_029127 [Riccia fluitans]|uniref:Uncharacterized protein n=1 Tax=Riccia fluitans TaxID=41844 RepID=A0ABD1XNM4_9MARC
MSSLQSVFLNQAAIGAGLLPVQRCEVLRPGLGNATPPKRLHVLSPWSIKLERAGATEESAVCRAELGGDDCESKHQRAAGEESVRSCKHAVLTTSLAMALSLSLQHGTAGNAEATVNFVAPSFPWERAQEHLQQPEPSKGSCATCIGVVDETLGTCNSTLNCVSTFDDRPKYFMAPWEFPGKLPDALKVLKETLLSMGADLIAEPEERYVHAVFTDKKDGVIDDVEFLFSKPSEDATVVMRAASRAQGVADNERNKRRLEQIRSTLTWEQVPILRNRSRALFFLESPWDTFGPEPPPTYDFNESLDFVPE